jgi:hypothetical protein
MTTAERVNRRLLFYYFLYLFHPSYIPVFSNMFHFHVSPCFLFASMLALVFLQFESCLTALDRCCSVEACEALETLLIYMDNIINAPLDTKYRSVRYSNPQYQERLGHLNGIVLILSATQQCDSIQYKLFFAVHSSVIFHFPLQQLPILPVGLLEALGFHLEKDFLKLDAACYTAGPGTPSPKPASAASSMAGGAAAARGSGLGAGAWQVEVPSRAAAAALPLSALVAMRDSAARKAAVLRGQWTTYCKAPPASHTWVSAFAVGSADDIGPRPTMEDELRVVSVSSYKLEQFFIPCLTMTAFRPAISTSRLS